jgi:hypothetical protein
MHHHHAERLARMRMEQIREDAERARMLAGRKPVPLRIVLRARLHRIRARLTRRGRVPVAPAERYDAAGH